MRRLRRTAAALVVALVVAGCAASSSDDDGATPVDTVAGTSSTAPSTSAPAEGRRFHASPDGGEDATGTASDPFGSLAEAFARLRAGDTLVVGGGTYDEDIEPEEDDLHPGTADEPILVEAAPGERPVVQGRIVLFDADHWTLRGINVTWADRNESEDHMVVFNGGVGFRFTGAEVWGARSFAAIVTGYGSRDFRLDNLYVHHTYPANDENQDHLVYLSADSTGGIVEHNVLAHSPNGRGVKIGPGSLSEPGASDNVIRYNTFYANEGPSNIQISGDSSGNEIYRNIMVRSAAEAVTGYELDGDGNVVRDNLVWEADGVIEEDDGLVDGGGNVVEDPELADPDDGDFTPEAQVASRYGAQATP